MSYKKEGIAIGIGLLLIIGFTVWGIIDSKKAHAPAQEQEETDIIYYYGEDCSHCKDVLAFLDENSVSEKVAFSKKEVWADKSNSEEMLQKAHQCGFDTKQLGVPFLYARGECFIGAPDVIQFFQEEMDLQDIDVVDYGNEETEGVEEIINEEGVKTPSEE